MPVANYLSALCWVHRRKREEQGGCQLEVKRRCPSSDTIRRQQHPQTSQSAVSTCHSSKLTHTSKRWSWKELHTLRHTLIGRATCMTRQNFTCLSLNQTTKMRLKCRHLYSRGCNIAIVPDFYRVKTNWRINWQTVLRPGADLAVVIS